MRPRQALLRTVGVLSGVGPVAAVSLTVSLVACGPVMPRKADPIPAALVPPGFTAGDCHWVEDQPQDSGGYSSMDEASRAAAQQKSGRHVSCRTHTTVEGTPTRHCMVNGIEQADDSACHHSQTPR
jgi:hypothetical protein